MLEAITAMARIATLAFYPDGTKVAFRNHNIVLCPPSVVYGYSLIPTKILQGIDRYWNSDSRDDLHIFNHTIKNYIDLYVEPYKRKDKTTHDNLINLAKYTCVGLIKLQKTYSEEHCNATLVIQLYINVLRDLIRGKHDVSSCYTPDDNDSIHAIGDDKTDQALTMSTIFDMDKIRTFWSQKELNRLCDKFNGCFKNQEQVDEAIFSNNTSNDMFGLILGNSTLSEIQSDIKAEQMKVESSGKTEETNSPAAQSIMDFESGRGELINIDSGEFADASPNFALPEPSNKSLPIVKGMIVSIIAILDAMDERFSTILTQSMQGVK